MNELIYKTPLAVFEAFSDIIERIRQDVFDNVVWDDDEGVLEYDAYGKHIVKVFDLTQGTPEVTADVMQWLFSMLDGAANL